jgi:hypothetical protein
MTMEHLVRRKFAVNISTRENACFSTILFTTNPIKPGFEPMPPRWEAAAAEVDGSNPLPPPGGGFRTKSKFKTGR